MKVIGNVASVKLGKLLQGKTVESHRLVCRADWVMVELETEEDKISYNEFHAAGVITHMAIIEKGTFVPKSKPFKDHDGIFCFVVN